MANKLEKKILIIEDDNLLAIALKNRISKAGMEVYLAVDGQMGLDLLKECKPDLIILDLVMPKMGGFEFLTGIKLSGNQIPVLILSNLGQADEVKRGMELGAIDYLVKSDVSLKSVVEKITEIFNK